MTYILGLNAYHADAAACLVKDGTLVAAVEEERFRRIKHWGGFPGESIRYCLGEAYRIDEGASHGVGRLVIEATPGQIGRILGWNDGIRWGVNLRIGGVQVPEIDVRTAIRLSPFEPEDAPALQSMARSAWAGAPGIRAYNSWRSAPAR